MIDFCCSRQLREERHPAPKEKAKKKKKDGTGRFGVAGAPQSSLAHRIGAGILRCRTARSRKRIAGALLLATVLIFWPAVVPESVLAAQCVAFPSATDGRASSLGRVPRPCVADYAKFSTELRRHLAGSREGLDRAARDALIEAAQQGIFDLFVSDPRPTGLRCGRGRF